MTAMMGVKLVQWVRWVLRFQGLVVVLAVLAALFGLRYSATHLGINTDTANMISAKLPWRRDFIDYRESFPARDRNIVIVVEADTAGRADAFATALVERLRQNPRLFKSVFSAGVGDFFERNGLLYLSVDALEKLSDRLAEAQPLIGRLRPAFDGAAVVDLAGEALTSREPAAGDAAASALYGELADAFDAAKADRADPIAWRRLLAGGAESGTRRLILLQPKLDFTRVMPAAEAISTIREAVGELRRGDLAGVTAKLTGTVALEHDEMLTVTRNAGLAGLSSLAMVGLLLYATLRSFKLLAISIATLVVGLAGTATFAALTVGHLNLLSVEFAVLYVGLGVDFIIHICLRVKELMASGSAPQQAIVDAIRGVGASLVVCAVTTAAGFYAFVPTPFDGVSELGIISGTGMFISLFVSLTLLPALLGLSLGERDRRARKAWLGTRWLGVLGERPRLVVTVAAAAVAVTLAALPRIEFDSNPIHLRDPHSESVRALEELANDNEAPLFDLVAVAPNHAVALEWAGKLRGLPTVQSVETVDSLVPSDQPEKLGILEDMGLVLGPDFAELRRRPADPARLERALTGLEKRLERPDADPEAGRLRSSVAGLLAALRDAPPGERDARLASLDRALTGELPHELERLAAGLDARPFGRSALPAALAERWIAADGRELVEITPRENINDNAAAKRFVSSVRAVVPSATGLPVVNQEASRTVVLSFQLALLYAFVMVAILLWIFLRRPRDVLYVIVPIVLAAGVTAGAMVLLGIPLNFANIIALPLLAGVGVDNGIHIVHRMRTEPAEDRRPFGTSTSLAVLASGLTTVASFGNLAFASHVGIASMGQLLTLGMLVTLAATLVLLPALLRLLEPA